MILATSLRSRWNSGTRMEKAIAFTCLFVAGVSLVRGKWLAGLGWACVGVVFAFAKPPTYAQIVVVHAEHLAQRTAQLTVENMLAVAAAHRPEGR